MPKPLRGLVAVAEFGSVFEGEAAARALTEAGIAATASYDPAMNSVASYFASDRVVEVVVRDEDADGAREFLAAGPGDLPAAFTSPDVEAWSEARTHRAARPATRWPGMRLLLAVAVGALVLAALVAALR